jgi:hypothetical protein
MDPLEIISFLLDVTLIVAAVVAYHARPRIGGQLAIGLRILLVGVMILGLAHFIETALFVVFMLDLHLNEVIHRVLVVIGFGFVILGFYRMRRAFED